MSMTVDNWKQSETISYSYHKNIHKLNIYL